MSEESVEIRLFGKIISNVISDQIDFEMPIISLTDEKLRCLSNEVEPPQMEYQQMCRVINFSGNLTAIEIFIHYVINRKIKISYRRIKNRAKKK